MPFVQRDGVKVHYLDVGKGPAVLLLHAFPMSGEMFRPQIDALSARYRMLVPDLRGFGQSEVRADVSEMATLAEDAQAVLEDAKEPAAIVGGVSMGGYAAMALLRVNAGCVKALALIDTHARADEPAAKAAREVTAREVLDKGMGVLAESMIPKLLSPDPPAPVVAEVRRLILENAPAGAAAALRGMANRPDSREVLQRFHGPTLLAWGERDAITPRERHDELVSLMKGARAVIVPKAGHLSNMEAPSEMNRTLEEFFGYCVQTT